MLVCMYVCQPKIVKCQFFLCFFPNSSNLSTISMVAQEKKHKNVSFYGVCMYVRPKLTFVSFFMFFFAPSPQYLYQSESHQLSLHNVSQGKVQKNIKKTNKCQFWPYIHTYSIKTNILCFFSQATIGKFDFFSSNRWRCHYKFFSKCSLP